MDRYFERRMLPTRWCAGCGNGMILNALLRAFAQLDLDPRRIVVVGGIGCAGQTIFYCKTNVVHTIHGRALAVATGIKVARPDLEVIAVMGDGDCANIGGNHLIHAARRNVNITAIVSNNFIYGMTSGQVSSTTVLDSHTATTPYGNPEPGFDLCYLVQAAGAPFVARTTVYHVRDLSKLMTAAIFKKGFSFLEVLSSCPTFYGRYSGRPDTVKMLEWFRDETRKAEKPIFRIGQLVNQPSVDFHARYTQVREKGKAR